jgi:hypothetical protein
MISPVQWLWRRTLCPRPQHLPHLPHSSLGGCAGVLLVLLLLTGCASASSAAPRATLTATTRPSPTPIPKVQLSPVLTPLAPPPQHCAITPPPQQQTVAQLGPNANAQLVGGGPFWIYGGYYQNVLHLGSFAGPAWPIAKLVVEVGPNYTQPVTLRLRNLETGLLAWWTDGGTPPGAATQTLVLDPLTDTDSVGTVPGLPNIPHGEVQPGWREWGIFPLFQAAGCYALEVSWSGGSWQSIFAAGN